MLSRIDGIQQPDTPEVTIVDTPGAAYASLGVSMVAMVGLHGTSAV